MIIVKDIMTTTLYTLKATDSIDMARRLMAERAVRHIPIVDDQDHLVGLVSQRDVLAASLSALANINEAERQAFNASTSLQSLMTQAPSVIPETMSLREAALHMQAHKYGCLPVVRQGRLIGMVTDSDFVAVAINLLEQLELVEPVDEDLDAD